MRRVQVLVPCRPRRDQDVPVRGLDVPGTEQIPRRVDRPRCVVRASSSRVLNMRALKNTYSFPEPAMITASPLCSRVDGCRSPGTGPGCPAWSTARTWPRNRAGYLVVVIPAGRLGSQRRRVGGRDGAAGQRRPRSQQAAAGPLPGWGSRPGAALAARSQAASGRAWAAPRGRGGRFVGTGWLTSACRSSSQIGLGQADRPDGHRPGDHDRIGPVPEQRHGQDRAGQPGPRQRDPNVHRPSRLLAEPLAVTVKDSLRRSATLIRLRA